jgi:preprotein translocase subunit YajC
MHRGDIVIKGGATREVTNVSDEFITIIVPGAGEMTVKREGWKLHTEFKVGMCVRNIYSGLRGNVSKIYTNRLEVFVTDPGITEHVRGHFFTDNYFGWVKVDFDDRVDRLKAVFENKSPESIAKMLLYGNGELRQMFVNYVKPDEVTIDCVRRVLSKHEAQLSDVKRIANAKYTNARKIELIQQILRNV